MNFLLLVMLFMWVGQNSAADGTESKTYEVVSIKPSKFFTSGGTQELPDGFRYTNMILDAFVDGAYDIDGDHVSGMPSWAKSDHFDIEGKVDRIRLSVGGASPSKERWKQEQPMQQALLADRCKLKVHFETREMQAYDLVIAKEGPKMKEASSDEKPTGSMSDGTIIVRQ